MSRHQAALPPSIDGPKNNSDWQTVKSLWPYIWQSKYRVIIAFIALTAAKVANLGIPIVLKKIVDGMSPTETALSIALISGPPP